ncbi:MAG: acyl-CoA ligase (AMP-forming), exosortase A system-associated [Pseudomonadota bacterium]
MLLHDLILQHEDSRADATALIRGADALTYAELADAVRAISSALRSLDIAAGARVAVYMNKRVEGAISYFASSHAGAVFVPINPVLKAPQVGHILKDCTVSALITTSALAATLQDELAGSDSVRHLILIDETGSQPELSGPLATHSWSTLLGNATRDMPAASRIDNDVAAILYTSGSTGSPKGVVLSQRNMVSGAISVASYLKNTADDVILAALPLSFDAGFSQMTTAFASGATVVLMDYLLPQDVPKAIAKHGATGLTGVPPLWNQLAKSKWPDEAVESLRYIANTGGAMPTATLKRLRDMLPSTDVFLMYGLTESFRSTYLPPEELDRRPTSMGKAIPNAEILVVREDGSLCDADEPGELVHRGALVSLGYWNDPDRSTTRFKPVPNRQKELPFEELAVWSGDTVTRDSDGFLYFVGRKDDMIKSSGYRISPTEVEEIIYKTGFVTECAALGIPHPEIGQAVVVVAHSKTANDDTSAKILATCRQVMPNFMVPAQIIWQDTLPKNPNGKIDRKRLSGDYQDLYREER